MTDTFDKLRARAIVLEAQVAKLEAGTDPDLPDDPELRARLLWSGNEALHLCRKLMAELLSKGLADVPTEDLA